MSAQKMEAGRIKKALQLMAPVPKVSLPLIVKGKGATIWDDEGNEYIDCHSGPGVCNVGHCHPQLIEAIEAQVKRLIISPFRTSHGPLIELCEELGNIMPNPLKRAFLCNSGTEACEGAVKVARKHAVMNGKTGTCVVSLEHSYHGMDGLSSTLTAQKRYKKKIAGHAIYPGILHIPAPYCYRCYLEFPDCGIHCARALESIENCRGAEDIAALIYEPILGAGGIIVPPKEYHQMIGKICKDYGINLILDEVFTGFGRTGKMFACEHWKIEPDIMTVAKAIGGGFPIGAILMSEEIAHSIEPGDLVHTFSGNPLACAAALASLKIIKTEKLPERAARIGLFMIKGLEAIKNEGIFEGDVRGLGLAIGIELVKDEKTKSPDPLKAKKLEEDALKQGVIVQASGAYENVIRINPPLTISEEQADKAITVITKCLKSLR